MIKLCKKCGSEIPPTMIIDGKKRSLTSRKYCLNCSPFNGRNTIQIEKDSAISVIDGMKLCTKCGRSRPTSKFYRKKSRIGLTSWCKECFKINSREQQRHFKVLCVKYKGGVCEICGATGHPAIFDFHHKDPSRKDFGIASYPGRNNGKLTEEVMRELDKCLLVCSNCHRTIHYDE